MKILLALDESPCSEAALAAVVRQFPPSESDVRVLHVDDWPRGLPVSAAFAEGPAAASSILAAHDELRRRGEGILSRAERCLKTARFRVETEMRQGDVRDAILNCAETWHPDVIVVGSHGRRGLKRLVLGSVSDGVVRQATCSVEVVRA